ncbi:MAG TPA: hypothetical protein VLA29_07390 [Acidimicrobiia bacterium]|nr:hypothetical protein [Acidimicrobiia bacterium]
MKPGIVRHLAVIAVVSLTVAACGSGTDATTTTGGGSDGSTTTTEPGSTTTTTASETTTTSQATTTTTSQPSATTTSQATTTTTTTDADASLELSDEGLQVGSTWVPFGTGDAETITAISGILGVPDRDSGWIDSFSEYGTCPGSAVRGVHWDAFVVLFTEAETDFWTAGVPHFFAWYYTSEPPELATTRGLIIGDTLGTLEALYGGPDLEIAENPFDPIGYIWLYDMVGWTGIWGYVDGQDPTSAISSINGGLGCGE